VILAYHVILSAYGFWLPNDPRGSWSDFCAAWELLRYGGKATKVETTRSVARVKHDRAKRLEMKIHLKRASVRWTGRQARAIARGFAKAVEESGYRIPACSILDNHTHLIIDRCERPIAQIVTHLKGRATQQVRAEGIHPFERFADADGSVPTMWAGKYWKVFIDNDEHYANAIQYVERNPLKEGKKRQDWSFVREARDGQGAHFDARRKRRG
jgi:REP element-mobilizing transposase RayT